MTHAQQTHCPDIVRRLVPFLLLCLSLVVPNAFAEPVPGGTLSPEDIPKYITPLVIPPVMPNDGMMDSYDIAVRQFQQQILPAPLPPTTVWSYGAAADPTPAVAPDPGSSFNYPAYTVETTSNIPVNVRWINDLVDGYGNFRPHLLPIDQTLHWANPAKETLCKTGAPGIDCATNEPSFYQGPVPIVTHVHGAHVDPHSDGYPEAWWLPAGVDTSQYETKGTLFDDATGINGGTDGYADYSYRNDQPATTLWYHDHTLGMTRANVYAGPAGFWLIRGGGFDKGVDSSTNKKAVLPGPAPVAADTLLALNTPGNPVRSAIREIPIVIQDRSFNTDGSLFYPDTREFFDGFTGPYTPDYVGAEMSDIAPAWNPEAFFNVMVVNGVSWPQMEVAPANYRLRLLNGCNSRFLNLALFVVNDDGTLGDEIPFYQIGADQGFLPQVVRVKTGEATPLPGPPVFAPDPDQALLMALAERADVIVNFSGLEDGTVVRMINTAADAPFGGFDGDEGEEEIADPGTTGQVMQFVVDSALSLPSDAMVTLPENLELKTEKPLDMRKIKVTRQISLNEGESETVCLTEDGESVPTYDTNCHELVAPKEALLGQVDLSDPNNPSGIPLKWTDVSGASTPVQITMADGVTTKMINVTENPTLGQTENWEIYNFTEDAHPIHLHLVRFEVVKRTAMDGVTPSPNGSKQPWEAGFKDTVIAYPGEITTVRAKFDIAGLFVWHCHILEHEDNEMMRPYVVSPKQP
ncbi:MAG: copper oxidase [Desulfuromonas sp.]|nr:MAG: copper oxidase [Desulfuromonas sp.]